MTSIGQIKRNLNFQPPVFTPPMVSQPESRAVYASKDLLDSPPKRLINADFNPVVDEEPPPPNSEVWKPEDPEAQPVGIGSLRKFLNATDIENEKYDWRRETKKGIKSHKNFTLYLKDAIE